MEKLLNEQTRKELEARYDKYIARFHEQLVASQEKSREAMHAAMTTARENLVAVEEISAEQGKLFTAYLKRDLAQTSKDMEQLGTEAREHLHPARLGAGALAATAEVLRLFGHTLVNLSDKADEALVYNAGEITSAGTLTCLKCGAKQELKKTTVIDPCPTCVGTLYKKSY